MSTITNGKNLFSAAGNFLGGFPSHSQRWKVDLTKLPQTSGWVLPRQANFRWLTPTYCLATSSFPLLQEFQLDGVADTVALIANVQQTGFYRVNYDQRNWQMLAELLLADHASVHRINRAQVRLVQNVTQKISLPNTQKCDTQSVPPRYSMMHLTWPGRVSWNTQQP